LEGYKLKEYAAIMGGRGIGKSFITDSVLAWYYMIFDKQEIIVSATSDPIVEEAWDKVDTIKAIEKEYRGLSNTRW
jgi:ERCC4-related helicase